MDFYTPLFSRIVDSSLWSEPDYVVKVFITMIAKKDRDQICRGTAYNIALWARKSEEEVVKALKILAAPDAKRLEKQPHDGRRIERVPDGWLILNGLYYQNLMTQVNRRAYKAQKEAERRARLKPSVPAAGERRYVAAVEAGDQVLADRIAAGEG